MLIWQEKLINKLLNSNCQHSLFLYDILPNKLESKVKVVYDRCMARNHLINGQFWHKNGNQYTVYTCMYSCCFWQKLSINFINLGPSLHFGQISLRNREIMWVQRSELSSLFTKKMSKWQGMGTLFINIYKFKEYINTWTCMIQNGSGLNDWILSCLSTQNPRVGVWHGPYEIRVLSRSPYFPCCDKKKN